MEYCFLLFICSIVLICARFVISYFWHKELLPDLGRRYVLVTGCDSGFGQLLVKKLDKLRVPVFAACLTKKGELHLRQRCSKRLKAVHLDVTVENDIMEIVRFVEKTLPKGEGLWGLVNNAGIQILSAPLEWHTREDYTRTLAVNLLGPIQLTTALLPLLRKAGGRVVNLSSDAALIAWPGVCPYNISKFGIEAFTDTLRREMYHTNLSAHIIQPGSFRTCIFNSDRLVKTLQARYEDQPEPVKEFYGRRFVSEWRQRLILHPYTEQQDLSEVPESIVHALFAVHPRYRYRVGLDCRFKFWPLSLLPECLSDMYLSFPRFSDRETVS